VDLCATCATVAPRPALENITHGRFLFESTDFPHLGKNSETGSGLGSRGRISSAGDALGRISAAGDNTGIYKDKQYMKKNQSSGLESGLAGARSALPEAMFQRLLKFTDILG
jgi:hypothetical protein